MFCSKCGSSLADNSVFCTFCGERIDGVNSASVPVPVFEKPTAEEAVDSASPSVPESEAAPEATFDTTPKATFDTTPQATFDTTSKATFDTTPKATFDTTPKATFDTTPKATFDTTPKATFDTTPKATFDTTPKATFDTTPAAAQTEAAESTEEKTAVTEQPAGSAADITKTLPAERHSEFKTEAPFLNSQAVVPTVPPQTPAPEKYYTFGHIAMCLAAVAVMAIVAGVFAGLYFSVI